MRKNLFLLYGCGCYLLFLAVYGYFAAFVGGFVVPRTIDGPLEASVGWAIAIDVALIALFALQHSVMARPGFKAVWTRIVPEPIERSTYVLASCLVLIAVMYWWQPIGGVVWKVENGVGWWTLMLLFTAGWLGVPLVTLLINHFDLFGVRQVWLHARGQAYTSLPFRTPLVYGLVRHPLYVAWAMAFWITPTMTTGHLLFAAGMTLYMALATVVEERDLINHFGRQYEDYRQRVPRFVPKLQKPRTAAEELPATTS
jgi:protein-S-isoprenylcysteine O-methyltransferase Ste14